MKRGRISKGNLLLLLDSRAHNTAVPAEKCHATVTLLLYIVTQFFFYNCNEKGSVRVSMTGCTWCCHSGKKRRLHEKIDAKNITYMHPMATTTLWCIGTTIKDKHNSKQNSRNFKHFPRVQWHIFAKRVWRVLLPY